MLQLEANMDMATTSVTITCMETPMDTTWATRMGMSRTEDSATHNQVLPTLLTMSMTTYTVTTLSRLLMTKIGTVLLVVDSPLQSKLLSEPPSLLPSVRPRLPEFSTLMEFFRREETDFRTSTMT